MVTTLAPHAQIAVLAEGCVLVCAVIATNTRAITMALCVRLTHLCWQADAHIRIARIVAHKNIMDVACVGHAMSTGAITAQCARLKEFDDLRMMLFACVSDVKKT